MEICEVGQAHNVRNTAKNMMNNALNNGTSKTTSLNFFSPVLGTIVVNISF